ncbi:hypothetical protein ACQP1O_43190 (plasmid) [Nocardia sp. CA-151230]|uniref:hypothetical protein n=1 Tax=Nocardia sp. CA-151230 TaxID=3239982 RepID=UPI003D8CED56
MSEPIAAPVAAEPQAPAAPAPSPAAPAAPPASTPSANGEDWRGIPLSEMTDAQRASYWQHYAREHESAVKAFKGVTPQEVAALKAKADALETEKMSADEKALKQAKQEAADAATAEAQSQFLPRIQALQVKAAASSILSGDQLKTFCDIVNPAALLGADGEVDESKVMGALTAMYPGQANPTQPQANTQRWQNAGQHSAPPPRGNTAVDQANQQLEKRFGIKQKS